VSSGGLQWWCSARGVPWTWSWQAYPGVWILIALVGALYARFAAARRLAVGVLAIVLCWIVLDWPVGPLGAGYLASVHVLQFLTLAVIAPHLFLLGASPERIASALERRPAVRRIVAFATQPLVAAIAFALVLVVTHAPPVVDRLMRLQAGAFLLDMSWLLSGLIFWWSVVIPVPQRPRFVPLLKVAYVFAGTQPHLYLAMWLMLAAFPVYGTFELAPRVTRVSALDDQQLAGGVMLTLGGLYILGVVTVLFFAWAHAAEQGGGDPRVA